jgi:hypothetical protein
MAGSSMTFSYDEGIHHDGSRHSIKKVIVDWTSDDTTGAVTGTTKKIVGTLIKGVTDPGAAAPSANYDIDITDEEGVNVLAACQSGLGNRHTADSEQVYFLVLDAAGTPLAQSIHPVVCDALTIAVTNAGNSKTGQLVLYYKS